MEWGGATRQCLRADCARAAAHRDGHGPHTLRPRRGLAVQVEVGSPIPTADWQVQGDGAGPHQNQKASAWARRAPLARTPLSTIHICAVRPIPWT